MEPLCSVYMLSAIMNCPNNGVNMQFYMLSVDVNFPTNRVNMQVFRSIKQTWAFISVMLPQ